ncbi:MdtA/MuxA family multidrug efflux RND transporter periplasmic adaptor subunit [Kerstersia similis]|uniref:MdtA/MuxA family multidrug efflux RND transporter periplasmic adaptor subunit n=1 Tax=Kerstersia similis TaxID=206505 RepID=UPI0039EF8F68
MSPPRPPRNRLLRLLLLVVILAAAAAVLWRYVIAPPAPPPSGFSSWNLPAPVRLAPVRQEALSEWIRAIGTVTPLNTVTVRSRVDGELVEVAFREGQYVKQGDVLARIDPAPYRIALSEAEGQLQQNTAQLRNAELKLQRYQTLFKQDSIARQELDSQQALAQQYKGTIRIDQARVDNARLQLSYTTITAPISGRIGLRQVDAGNLVRASDSTGMAVITQMQPISVVFSIPENRLPALLEAMHGGTTLAVEAWDRNDQTLLARGTLGTLDNRIDTATGTLKLRADFANTDETLFPNQFVNVRLRLATLPDALTIPTDAVQYGARGAYVYLVDDAHKAYIRPVKLGISDDGRIAVLDGLSAGDDVVLEGLDRLREGRDVRIVDESGGTVGAPAGQQRPDPRR